MLEFTYTDIRESFEKFDKIFGWNYHNATFGGFWSFGLNEDVKVWQHQDFQGKLLNNVKKINITLKYDYDHTQFWGSDLVIADQDIKQMPKVNVTPPSYVRLDFDNKEDEVWEDA